jgi:hypothetical protein
VPAVFSKHDFEVAASQFLFNGEIWEASDSEASRNHIDQRFDGIHHSSSREIDVDASTIFDERPAFQLATCRIPMMEAGVILEMLNVCGQSVTLDIAG